MNTLQAAIERGTARAITHWRDGDIETREVSTVVVDLIMGEPLLSDYVLGILDAEFRQHVKDTLIELGQRIERSGCNIPPSALPDRIAEWGEDIDKINCAIFEFVEAEDVLRALEIIAMPGCDWSTLRQEEEADGK